ncbi:hypothetical protein AcW1_004532 [Taiwanofungus camphoratus]|nr:hypothetical protein AcV5_000914 [Antrodia cinnamomea]KAI0952439.1 hypothetical protein AcV7_008244 [Antrodia cinnamomea]KAI0959816.1 hypothetical protein AcW1_004532 [Antrodia cinnamomea]
MSATSNVVRRNLRRMASSRRYVSFTSSSKIGAPASDRLSREKMRALVSLYHETETFITPQNLSEAIDRAFITEPSKQSAVMSPETSYRVLLDEMRMRKAQPKIGEAPQARLSEDSEWSEGRRKRERTVLQALYGIEGRGKPGLEVLEDEAERIESHLKRDHESRS